MTDPKDELGWVDNEPEISAQARRDAVIAQIVVGLIFVLVVSLTFLIPYVTPPFSK